jgi:pimeloyl-ACP methyl ester carboxylesterase
MQKLIAAATACCALLLSACGSAGYGTVTGPDTAGFAGNPNPGGASCSSPTRPANTALFCPASGLLPYPFDAYFAFSTDGTLNIQPPNQLWPGQPALNGLDGFSTTAPIRETFNGPIDAASLGNAGAVIVVHINTNNLTKAPVKPAVAGGTGVFVPLAGCVKGGATCTAANFDYMVGVADENPTILEITPLRPLAASTCLPTPPATTSPCAAADGGNGEAYMVLLTKAITVDGAPAVADVDYANFEAALASGGPTCPSITDPTLNALCQLSGAHPANVVASFSFSTQSTVDTLAAAASQATPQLIKLNPTGQTTAAFQGLGLADVYVGVMTLPYYLSKADPDHGMWQASASSAPDKTSTYTTRFNPFPIATVKQLQVPVLVTVPNAASGAVKPGTGWPIVVFEHGITANRTNLFGIADSLALGGLASIAIDLPLHGLTAPFNPADPSTYLYAIGTNPLYANLGLPMATSIERTFDLTTLSNGAAIDPSGSHYVALGSLLTFRDNLRESSVDLVTVAESVGTILPPGGTAPFIDPTQVHYIGHSQGAIVGTGFLAVMPPGTVLSATLANPGGKFIYLGLESPTFGNAFIPALEQASGGLLTPGTTPFALFARDAQTAIDSGDPWNFIAQATAFHPIHLIQVVGITPPLAGCIASAPVPGCPDQVVPNDATQRLIDAGGFAQAHPPGASGPALHVFVNFTSGTHSSFLNPKAGGLAITQEMQLEAVSFTGAAIPAFGIPATSPGTNLVIANPMVVQ